MLVIDGDSALPFRAAVVVIGRKLLEIRLEDGLLDPPVEPDDFGMILLDDLRRARQPVIEIILIGLRLIGLRRAVEPGIARVSDIGIERHAAIVEPPVLGAMRRRAEVQSLPSDGCGQLVHHVALWPHPGGAPLGQVAVVHREAVVMLRHGDHVFRSGLPEQLGPRVGIELLSPEHRDEVLIAELRLRAIGRNVMFERRTAQNVHVARIPLAVKTRN